jgi:hypothetical protein
MSRRIAAILYVVPGLGFGISALLILAYHDRRGELPMTPFGWRLMGSTAPGMGTDQLTSLGGTLAWVLIAVSAIDVATGRWSGRTVVGAAWSAWRRLPSASAWG